MLVFGRLPSFVVIVFICLVGFSPFFFQFRLSCLQHGGLGEWRVLSPTQALCEDGEGVWPGVQCLGGEGAP